MVLDLPSDVWAQIDAMAREKGVLLSQYAVASVSNRSGGELDYDVSGFADENDTPIGAEEAAFLHEGTLRGFEAEAAGQYKPLAQVVAETRVRHKLPKDWGEDI